MEASDPGQERHLTDSGLTGDKVNAPDPAAAPVQTDAEAAGLPTAYGTALASAKHQMAIALATPSPDVFSAWPQRDAQYQRHLGWLLFGWTFVLVGTGVVAGMVGWP